MKSWNLTGPRFSAAAYCLAAGFALAGCGGMPAVSAVQDRDAAGEAADDPVWATLTGRIVVEGDVPEAPDEIVDKDAAICTVDGKAPKDDNLVVGPDGGLRDVIVMMYLEGSPPVPVHPRYGRPREQALVLDNVRCRFEPHVLFVRTGDPLILRNSDEVGHNCHIITFGNEENVNLSAYSEVEVRLRNADKVPGNVVCDIHKWMDAVILVRDEPYAAVTAADGQFTIADVPAGTWKFQFWHKKGGYLRGLKIDGREPGRRGEIELELRDGETLDLGVLKIPVESLNK